MLVMSFMAWSPVRRTNIGRFEVDHPGDYATFNSYHPADGTGHRPADQEVHRAPEQIRKEIAALKADKSIPEGEKKDDLEDLEAALKTARPIQFKENIALVLKYFDKLAPLMQEDVNPRPAD